MIQMIITEYDRTNWPRCAQAMYARGFNNLGHLLSANAAKRAVPLHVFDHCASVYRAWLVFDEPKAEVQS